MSGPWDPDSGPRRQPEEPDLDRPARDSEPALGWGRVEGSQERPSEQSPGWDDWSGTSPGEGSSTQPASGWDDWPPSVPEPDLFPEPGDQAEPAPPSSDPWAESWEWDAWPPEPVRPRPTWRPEPEGEAELTPAQEADRRPAPAHLAPPPEQEETAQSIAESEPEPVTATLPAAAPPEAAPAPWEGWRPDPEAVAEVITAPRIRPEVPAEQAAAPGEAQAPEAEPRLVEPKPVEPTPVEPQAGEPQAAIVEPPPAEPQAAIVAPPPAEPEAVWPEAVRTETVSPAEAEQSSSGPTPARALEETSVLPTVPGAATQEGPSRDQARREELSPEAGRIDMVSGELWDGLDRRTATTAEQAVPWLIGVILLLAGMVIVLLALIFLGEQSLGGVTVSPSPSAEVASHTAEPTPQPTPQASQTPNSSPSGPTPTPIPIPEYGPLEMVYMGRSAALAPIYLLRHDFTTSDQPVVLAQDPTLDVNGMGWAVDGTRGAALLADVLVSIEPDVEKRRMADGISSMTFGNTRDTVYAVRITPNGARDLATVLAIDFLSAGTVELASVTYTRPTVGAEGPLREAQFADDGGLARLYWLEDGTLRLWVLGALTWEINPGDGAVRELTADAVPLLWSPEGDRRVEVTEADATSSLVLYADSGEELGRTTVEGLVSHLRWAPDGSQVVFTLGRSGVSGGVQQDLFLWNLEPDAPPMQLTNTGAAFGAEWLGSMPSWRP